MTVNTTVPYTCGTPTNIPHIAAQSLINHMKLYINRPNTKRGKEEEDRKKKEQESTEVISGLKKWCICKNNDKVRNLPKAVSKHENKTEVFEHRFVNSYGKRNEKCNHAKKWCLFALMNFVVALKFFMIKSFYACCIFIAMIRIPLATYTRIWNTYPIYG